MLILSEMSQQPVLRIYMYIAIRTCKDMALIAAVLVAVIVPAVAAVVVP